MAPIFFTLNNGLKVMILPNTKVHLDGHTVITRVYSIFLDNAENRSETFNRNITKNDWAGHPDYFGSITFEDSQHLFSYAPDGSRDLTRDELDGIIENIKHYRDNPYLWNHN